MCEFGSEHRVNEIGGDSIKHSASHSAVWESP